MVLARKYNQDKLICRKCVAARLLRRAARAAATTGAEKFVPRLQPL